MDKIIKTILLFTLYCFVNLVAQDTSQPQQQQQQTQQDQVMDLGEIRIDARVELPQVQILDQRIQPDFEDVRAEKSFQAELTGGSEQLKFNAITSGRVTKIKDIKALLNKKRF